MAKLDQCADCGASRREHMEEEDRTEPTRFDHDFVAVDSLDDVAMVIDEDEVLVAKLFYPQVTSDPASQPIIAEFHLPLADAGKGVAFRMPIDGLAHLFRSYARAIDNAMTEGNKDLLAVEREILF